MLKNITQIGRMALHASRRALWLYELDAGGWAEVVLAALRQERAEWRELGEADLADMIRHSSKQCHETAGGRIPALYGHSLPRQARARCRGAAGRAASWLRVEAVAKIRAAGLLPMRRHLCVD
jgi:putative RNA 2'-phosphotransferase